MLVSVLKLLKIIFLLGISVFILNSCATLNKDECRTANWKLIGLEDGSRGYPVDRIGLHRKACAEYGISPNLEQYKLGRAEGLHKYCIPANGYNLGKNGATYGGICSGYNEAGFLSAYQQGQQLRAAKLDLQSKQKLLQKKQKDLDHNIATIRDNELKIVSGKLTVAEAVLLLVETKELGVKQGVLNTEIHDLDAIINDLSANVAHLEQQYRY